MTVKDISEAKTAVARSGANTQRPKSVQQVGRGVLTPDYWWRFTQISAPVNNPPVKLLVALLVVCDCVCSVERGHAMVDVQKWLRRHCSDYYHFYCEAFLEQVITNLLKCLNS